MEERRRKVPCLSCASPHKIKSIRSFAPRLKDYEKNISSRQREKAMAKRPSGPVSSRRSISGESLANGTSCVVASVLGFGERCQGQSRCAFQALNVLNWGQRPGRDGRKFI